MHCHNFYLSLHSPGEEIKLERQVPPSGGTIVEVRRDTCVTFCFEMGKIAQRTPAEYAGFKIPCTISVKNSESTSTLKLLGLRVLFFGTTGGIKYESICGDCQKKENRPGSLFIINFRTKSDVVTALCAPAVGSEWVRVGARVGGWVWVGLGG